MAFEDFWFSKKATVAAGGSLRFSGAQYLYRVPTVTGNQKTWTLSAWVKRGTLSTNQVLFSQAYSNPNLCDSYWFANTDVGSFNYSAGTYSGATGSLYRDPGAWYHVLWVQDTTQAVAANRVKFYINGVLQTFSVGSFPPQNYNGAVNTASQTFFLGVYYEAINLFLYYFNGYMSDVFFSDGQALLPTTFGYFDANNVWVPYSFNSAKANVIAAGGFGTNGFALNFDSANFTSGPNTWADQSGNGNNFTANWDCAVGADGDIGSDISADAPTTNASTWNPLIPPYNLLPQSVLPSKGNMDLQWSPLATRYAVTASTGAIASTGTVTITNNFYTGDFQGACNQFFAFIEQVPSSLIDANPFFDVSPYYNVRIQMNGAPGTQNWTANVYEGSTLIGSGPMGPAGYNAPSFAGVLQSEFDRTANTIKFTNLSTGYSIGPLSVPNSAGKTLMFAGSGFDVGGVGASFNLNNDTYTNVAANLLPAAPIPNGTAGFQALLAPGASVLTTAQAAVPNGLWWIKDRVNANEHQLVNSVSGTGSTVSSPSRAVGAYSAPAGNSVAWCWAVPGAASANTNGSITSQVAANVATGFSIVTYTTAGGTSTVGHGLGSPPELIIAKNLNQPLYGLLVYSKFIGASNYLSLNSGQAANSDPTMWVTDPTSTVFTVGASFNNIPPGDSIVAYCWAPVSGYSSFGSYVGNGSTDGTFVYTGMKPAFVLIKCSSTTGNWEIYDNARNTYNPETLALQPDLTSAESTINGIDFVSNGFKIRTTDANLNTSGQTYIYAAFAQNPFGGSNVAPVTAR